MNIRTFGEGRLALTMAQTKPLMTAPEAICIMEILESSQRLLRSTVASLPPGFENRQLIVAIENDTETRWVSGPERRAQTRGSCRMVRLGPFPG